MPTSKHPDIGAAPGTLLEAQSDSRASVHVMAYGADTLHVIEAQDLSVLPDLVERHPVVWIDVIGHDDTATVKAIGDLFQLHPLALEDVQKTHQRPKFENYPSHIFVVVHLVELLDRLETEQVSLFCGQGFVITFQERTGDCFMPVRERLLAGTGQIRKKGADYSLYALLDAVVDHYFPVANQLGESLDILEDSVLDPKQRSPMYLQRKLMEIRHDLLQLKRATRPLELLLRQIQGPETAALISEESRIYLRDCLDHAVRVLELAEMHRDEAAHLMDTHIAISSQRLNEVMKVLTIISTIFIPLSFLVGLYGMNFNPAASPLNMPELNWYWGYPSLLGFMVIMVILQLIYFRRKGWW